METLIKFYLCIFAIGKIFCQSYNITILGYHTTDITQIVHNSGRIEFKTQNRGLADMIWPMNNYYDTSYDTQNFYLKTWSKNIKQGTFTNKNRCIINSQKNLLYNDHDTINISYPVHTIFTLIAKVQSESSDEIDARWFKFEHEGKLGRARFLLADSSMAWDGKDSILCDHYRLDLEIIDTSNTIEMSKDYFMKNITNESFVRELWVSRRPKRQIIVAKVITPWVTLKAQINATKEN